MSGHSYDGTQPLRRKPPKKELDHIRVHQAENGGHVIEHHFTSYEHEPEKHVFGENEGNAAMAHIAKHAGIKHDLAEAEGHDKEEIEA